MNHWSIRRKRFVLVLTLFTLLVFVGIPTGFLFYETPTCFDTKQNGSEAGIDCGGVCELLCSAESLPLVAKGDARVIEVAPGIYEVVAIYENPNASASASNANYSIKLFDSVGTAPLKVLNRSTYIPKASTFALFEGPIDMDNAHPTRAIIEWDYNSFSWKKDTVAKPKLVVKNIVIENALAEPRLTAIVVNDSLEEVRNIELVALISDVDGNVFASSRTIVEAVEKGASEPIVFSWRVPFETENVGIDIKGRVFPDSSFIR